MICNRSSGILIHITSLPGESGIGDLGQPVFNFLNFLKKSGQHCWQFLPTGPGSGVFGHSPYMSLSAFAGNPLLISLEALIEVGYLVVEDFVNRPAFSEYNVLFDQVEQYKDGLLKKAFERFQNMEVTEKFTSFCQEEKWLADYALFMSLREENDWKPWYEWPRTLATRNKKSLKAAKKRLAERIFYHQFVQFIFFEQWDKIRRHAAENGIKLIGDIPIYVSLDSADVWANQNCFKLDRKTLKPTVVSGVPPDYFSKTGQRWGNPIYQWQKGRRPNQALYEWWRRRFRKIGSMVDVVRIDHFRGFESFWQIPAQEKTAVKGTWEKGPGKFFFDQMAGDIDNLTIIAEDLGIITPEVEALRDECGFPGMKILQFAFDADAANSYLPHNYKNTNCVVYSGTHDNDTTLGWYLDPKTPQISKNRALRYSNSNGSRIYWDFIRLAYGSIAELAILPMQDVLGFGNDCRMNMPNSTTENWSWRLSSRFLTPEVCQNLLNEVIFYNRLPEGGCKKKGDKQ